MKIANLLKTIYHKQRKYHVEGQSHFAAASQDSDNWPRDRNYQLITHYLNFSAVIQLTEEINNPTCHRKRKKHWESLSDSIIDLLGSDRFLRRWKHSLSESQCSEFLKTVQ